MKSKGYEFRNHTADVELVAHGKSMEEAFSNALLALFDTSADIAALAKSKGSTMRIMIRDKASSLEDLLWVALQDALSIADAKGVYCYKVNRIKIAGAAGGYVISAELSAKEESPKYSVIYVKGVSRFALKVRKSAEGYRVRAVLDV